MSSLTSGSRFRVLSNLITDPVTPKPGSVLVLWITYGYLGGPVNTVSGLGLTWTQRVTPQSYSTYDTMECWTAPTGTSPGSGPVTVNFGGTTSYISWDLDQVTGGASVVSANTTTAAGTPSLGEAQLTLPAAAPGNVNLAACICKAGNVTAGSAPGWTPLALPATLTTEYSLAGGNTNLEFGNVTFGYVIAGIEIAPGGGNLSWAVPAPAGITQGDLLVLAVSGQNTGSYAVTDDWNVIESSPGVAGHAFLAATKTAGAAEPESYSPVSDTPCWPVSLILAIRGGDPVWPVVQSAEDTGTGYQTTLDTPALTGVLGTSLLIFGWGGAAAAAGDPGLSLPSPASLLSGSACQVTDAVNGSAYGLLACTSASPGSATATSGVDETDIAIEIALA